jgi:cytidylate kinase
MIIMIGGVPCAGKTTLMKKVISELGETELVEPMKLFKCMRYKKGLIVGNYPIGEMYGGTDRLAYGVISKFSRFITKQQKLHKHIIVEGDRFFIGKHLEWLFKKYKKNQVKVYILEASQEELDRRHKERKDNQKQKWLLGRQSLINNLKDNPSFVERLELRKVNSKSALTKVKNEIMKIVK